MLLNLTRKFCGRNRAACDELIGVGYEAILNFAAEKLVTDESELMFDEENKPLNMLLTPDTIESRKLRLAVFAVLKNKLRLYAYRMSGYSPVFRELYTEKQKKRYKAVSYANMAPNDDDTEVADSEFCPVEIIDKRCDADREMSEIMADASRFLDAKELEILKMRHEGRSTKEIAMLYGVSSAAISQRIKTIAGKLTPLGESLKSAA